MMQSVFTNMQMLTTSKALAPNNELQSDHTATAHSVLKEWASMRFFGGDVEYIKNLRQNNQDVSEYPMKLEQNRGVLRIWGSGEGQDLDDEDIWGHLPVENSCCGTSTVNRDGTSSHISLEGGLGPDGRPDFRSSVLWQLYDSYNTNMHTQQPFIDQSELEKMFKEFSNQYSPDVMSDSAASSAADALINSGMKRRRSSKGAIGRSLRNAIVLLVLAVGKVCAYTDQLPSPSSDKHTNTDTDDNRPRNVHILPGMGYFAYATEIFSSQHGGNTVAHAQAMILMALYLGQYVRVMESWSWINNACRVTMIHVKA
jgi:hypothetical protein